MSKENIPVLIRRIAESMLDKTVRSDVRFNHAQTLTNIKNFCEEVLKKHNTGK